MSKQLLTFIGNGNMARALAIGLQELFEIEVVGRSQEKMQKFEDALKNPIKKSLLKNFDISGKTVILCVKPANVVAMSELLVGEAEVMYSVLAGTSIEKLGANIKAKSYVRAMPNLAASVFKSMTTLTGDENYAEPAKEIFNAIGSTLWLSSEKEVDIATGLNGSGPAFLALVAEALADGAVNAGLKRADAMVLMRGLFDGFGTQIQNEHPALLKDGVMSPGGTTSAGYKALEDSGVRSAFMNSIEAAYKRTL